MPQTMLKEKRIVFHRHDVPVDELVQAARRGCYVAGARLDAVEDTVDQLLMQNDVLLNDNRQLSTCTDTELIDRLTTWRRPAQAAFLGLRVTTECNVGHDTTASRCVMCDQGLFGTAPWGDQLESWMRAIDDATEEGRRRGVLVNISGGEPLLRVDATLHLIRYAADRGAVVNLNSNGHALTPRLALRLIGAGLAKLHISLHAASAAVHEAIQPAARGYERALQGIEAMGHAKTLAAVDYPVMHLNYVLTRCNLQDYPAVVGWALQRRRTAPRYDRGHTQSNPNRRDLCVHLLGLVGDRYRRLQPDQQDLARFQADLFPLAEGLWQRWLDHHSVPQEHRCSYADLIVKTYFDASSAPPGPIAKRCHVGATQLYFLPDRSAYTCGRHADHQGAPSWPSNGKLGETPMAVIARSAVDARGLPSPACRSTCAANTREYNLAVERRLIDATRARLVTLHPGASAPDESQCADDGCPAPRGSGTLRERTPG